MFCGVRDRLRDRLWEILRHARDRIVDAFCAGVLQFGDDIFERLVRYAAAFRGLQEVAATTVLTA